VEANVDRSNYASIQPPPEEDDDVPPSPHAMFPSKYRVSAYPVQASQMTNSVKATTSTDKKSSTKRSAARSLASLNSKKKKYVTIYPGTSMLSFLRKHCITEHVANHATNKTGRPSTKHNTKSATNALRWNHHKFGTIRDFEDKLRISCIALLFTTKI